MEVIFLSKRKRLTNQKTINRFIREGRGSGRGKDYIPWIKIQDIASQGVSSRIRGNVVDRVHSFLSKLEISYFYLLEFSDGIIDIREQFPLFPVEDTELIARNLGVKYPRNPKTQEKIVMV